MTDLEFFTQAYLNNLRPSCGTHTTMAPKKAAELALDALDEYERVRENFDETGKWEA